MTLFETLLNDQKIPAAKTKMVLSSNQRDLVKN